MRPIFPKIASLLAFVIGAMAVVAGGRVLLGEIPDYYVINWLPIYNFTAGLVTILISAGLIWRNHRYALSIAIVTLGLHILVMVILQTAYRSVVAPDSLVAMSLRIGVWLIILTLLVIQARRARKNRSVRTSPK